MNKTFRTTVVNLKRFVLKVLRFGGIGFKLFGLPINRVMVCDTKSFFEDRLYSSYSFRSYCREEVVLKPAVLIKGQREIEPARYTYEHFVLCIPEGRYYHTHPSVITRGGYQLAIVSNHPELSQKQHVLFQEIFLPKKRKFKGLGLVLATANDNNYYHCLFQIPAKIWMLERVDIDWGGIDLFFLERSTAGFQEELISSLGIDKFRIIDLGKYPHVVSERLMALPAFWKPEPWICRKLRETFLQSETSEISGLQRLFISRSLAKYRRILDEKDLLKMLRKFGFQLVHLEGLTIREQAGLFQQARVVVSAHGAALANLVFCTPGTQVLEFRAVKHESDLGGVYEHLSSICNLEHFTYLCEGEGNDHGNLPKFLDLHVDVARVEDFLKHQIQHQRMAL